jgi:hypothetical protein
MRLSPAQRLRQHPDDPNVWEYSLSYMRAVFEETPCRGCPSHGVRPTRCEELPNERRCEQTTVWYGEHIEVANKLGGT